MLRTVDSATLCSRCPENFLAALATPLSTAYLAIFALVSSSYAEYSPLFLFSVFLIKWHRHHHCSLTRISFHLRFFFIRIRETRARRKPFLYFTSFQPRSQVHCYETSYNKQDISILRTDGLWGLLSVVIYISDELYPRPQADL